MKVLCFGMYNPDYPRNRVIIKGLRKNGVEVSECNVPSKILTPSGILRGYPKLIKKFIKKYRKDYDVLMVLPFGGIYTIPLAKTLTTLTMKPLIYDALISIYNTFVFDRKLVKENSLRSKFHFYLDKLACTLSDVVLVDTNEHMNYFHKTFKIEKKKFRRIFIGTDDSIFYPRGKIRDEDTFTVTFHGLFSPLHGIQYIVRAAKLLENHKDIKFEILGFGQTYAEIRDLSQKLNVKNIIFRGTMSYEELPNFIAKGDVCLGIFGDTAKAKMVIPNKVFEILAMKKPLLTGDTKAIREASIINRKNALLVKMADPTAIANGILELKENKKLRNDIAKSGYKLFKENFTPKIIGKELKRVLKETLELFGKK